MLMNLFSRMEDRYIRKSRPPCLLLDFSADLGSDDVEMRLSGEQLQYLDDWKRAKDAIPPPTWFGGDRSMFAPSLEREVPTMDLVQDATTDCSVVASMCACIARASKGTQNSWAS